MINQSERANILETIVRQKALEVERLPRKAVDLAVWREARATQGPRDFLAALRQPRRGSVALIAEVKQASPSAGIIRPNFDPVAIATAYAAAGASCLSVLTDEEFFKGSLTFLKAIRERVSLPLLRKDFLIDERQILESIEWGADAILLIVAILDDARLRRFHELATAAGLAVLVEVHDEEELERARAVGAELIGVNNRNLKTFQVDLATTERLAQRLFSSPAGENRLLVAESGIRTGQDVARLARCGARAILVGEALMRENDLTAKVEELCGGV